MYTWVAPLFLANKIREAEFQWEGICVGKMADTAIKLKTIRIPKHLSRVSFGYKLQKPK